MILLGDKVFIRITKDNRDGIFSKEIKRVDGTSVRLFINVPTSNETDERNATLFVSTGIVEAVAPSVENIKIGDIVLINYSLCNDQSKFVYKDSDGEVYWAHANTSYHDDDSIAYQTRRTKRDQIVHLKGDMDKISEILGIISDGILIANDPYVFLEHESNEHSFVSSAGIYYTKTEKIFDRRVLAVSKTSTDRTGIENRGIVKVNDTDIFTVKYNGLTVDCVNDSDCLCFERYIT